MCKKDNEITPCTLTTQPKYIFASQYIDNKDNTYSCIHKKPDEVMTFTLFKILYDCLTQVRENGILDIFNVKQYLDMYFEKEEVLLYLEALKELNVFINDEANQKSKEKTNILEKKDNN